MQGIRAVGRHSKLYTTSPGVTPPEHAESVASAVSGGVFSFSAALMKTLGSTTTLTRAGLTLGAGFINQPVDTLIPPLTLFNTRRRSFMSTLMLVSRRPPGGSVGYATGGNSTRRTFAGRNNRSGGSAVPPSVEK
jgi:hypothetical protein